MRQAGGRRKASSTATASSFLMGSMERRSSKRSFRCRLARKRWLTISLRYLKRTNRFDKTIVFCVDMEHAEDMRAALHRANEDLTGGCPHYVARVVSDEGKEGRRHLDHFRDPEKITPVILTTSQMLTTGVDLPDCRNIALSGNIESIIEFKQIIGRKKGPASILTRTSSFHYPRLRRRDSSLCRS